MSKLKLGPIVDDRPMKVTMELPASLHRDLTAYADYPDSLTVSVGFRKLKLAGFGGLAQASSQ